MREPPLPASLDDESDDEASELPTLEENLADGEDDECDGLTLEENVDLPLGLGVDDHDDLVLEENEVSDCEELMLEDNVAFAADEPPPLAVAATVPLGSGLLGLPASPSSLLQADAPTLLPGGATGATASPRAVKRRGTCGRGRPRKSSFADDVPAVSTGDGSHAEVQRKRLPDAKRAKPKDSVGLPAMATGCTGAA